VPIVEIFLLALGSMVWPTLIAVVVAALASSQPVRLLSWFLAGSLLTTVTIGTIIVTLLEQSYHVSRSSQTFDAATYFVAATVALLVAYIVWSRGRAKVEAPPTEPGRPSWSERSLARGGLLAFAAGIVLNVIPGVLPFVALKDIADLDYTPLGAVALVAGFYLVMFLPAEVPLGSYLLAPRRTTAAVDRFNTWLKRNARLIGVYVLVGAAIYLAVRGIVSL